MGRVIVDTSAWVEYLEGTGSPAHLALRARIESEAAIRVPAPVVMELLAGCASEQSTRDMIRFLARFDALGTHGLTDFEDAALLWRACRRTGHPVRSMTDCLVAAAAMRTGQPLLAHDPDLEALARHVGLDLVEP